MSKYEKRLARLEKRSGKNAIEIWRNIDGQMRGPRGEIMSRAQFEKSHPDAIPFTVDLNGDHDFEIDD